MVGWGRGIPQDAAMRDIPDSRSADAAPTRRRDRHSRPTGGQLTKRIVSGYVYQSPWLALTAATMQNTMFSA